MVACHLNRGICACHMCFSDFVCLLHRVGYPYIHELMYLTDRHVYTSVRGRESARARTTQKLDKKWTWSCGRCYDRQGRVCFKVGGTHVVCCLAEDLRYERLRHAFWPFSGGGLPKGKELKKKFDRSGVTLFPWLPFLFFLKITFEFLAKRRKGGSWDDFANRREH